MCVIADQFVCELKLHYFKLKLISKMLKMLKCQI